TANAVSILWNSGGAMPAFDPAVEVPLPITPWSIAFADLDGDGRADLAAVGGSTEQRLVVCLAGPGRSFGPPSIYTLPVGDLASERYLVAVDLDGDGDRELVTAEQESL